MQLPSLNQGEEPDNILPLVNVVFLLLIFFMLTGAIHAVDYFDVTPPVSTSEETLLVNETVILVNADGRLSIDGKEVDAIDLQLSVSDKLAQQTELEVRLKADGNVDAVTVVKVMEWLEAVGVRHLNLLTLEPET
jgi:biopolymer transport protein ExbD